MKDLIGKADILFLTLDTLRFDAAQQAWLDGRLITLAPYLGERGWEKRHTPGSFTYAAHHAFFSGFLPTPLGSGPHPRLFAAEFAGSVTTVESTFAFREATLPQALAARGYHTICIGGTGFFNQQNELARVLPGFFAEAHWHPDLGVACRNSAEVTHSRTTHRELASRSAISTRSIPPVLRRPSLERRAAAMTSSRTSVSGVVGSSTVAAYTLAAGPDPRSDVHAGIGNATTYCVYCSSGDIDRQLRVADRDRRPNDADDRYQHAEGLDGGPGP